MADSPHDNAYERCLRDSTLLDAVRAAHVGHWDVLDALWWHSHPADAAPSGTPSPSARLRDLQRRAFSADGDAIGDLAAAQRMRELEAEIADESNAIVNAVSAAQPESRTTATTLPEVAHPLASPPEVTAESPGEEVALNAPARWKFFLVLGIFTALAVGVLTGTQLANGNAAAPPPLASPSPPPVPAPIVGALSVFDRAPTPEDVPTQPVPQGFDLASFRSLGASAGTSTSPDRVSFYAAKTTSNMICIVALAAQIDHLATCILAGDFPSTGLRLYWQSDYAFQSEDGSSSVRPKDGYVVWKPDGILEGGGSEPAPAP